MSLFGALTLGLTNGFTGGDLPWTGRLVRALLPMRWACALRLHEWRICSVDLAGHESKRSRRCDACFVNGRLLIQTQKGGYFAEDVGEPWITETDERGMLIDGRFVKAGES